MLQCTRCRRHLRADTTVCPFCTDAPGRSRAGLLAAGLFALSGCSSHAPAPVYGGPPPPPTSTPSEAAPQSATSKAPATTVSAPTNQTPRAPVVAIYGGPPDTRDDRPPVKKDDEKAEAKPKKPQPMVEPAYGVPPVPEVTP